MKVKVNKANKNRVGMTIYECFREAREIAAELDNFKVRLYKVGNEMPRATWAKEFGDDVADIRPNFDKDEYDLIQVIDANTNTVVETILVNG